jgi:hypothetical protein
MFAGGCAGAGPSSGLSGWNSWSGAVTSPTPPTRSRTGRAPFRGVRVIVSPGCTWSVAANCWSSTIWSAFSDPRGNRNVSIDR